MKDLVAYFLMLGALSSGESLPFWSNANQCGIYPDASGGIAQVAIKTDFDTDKAFHYRFGGSFVARGDRYLKNQSPSRAFLVDELYGSIGWKCLTLDLGMKHPELDFYGSSANLGSLSTTGGHLIASGNARSQLGYNLILEKVAFPWTKNHLWFWGLFGDYIGTENFIGPKLNIPYIKNRLYHRTKFFTKIYVDPQTRWYITLGIDHYALWGGYREKDGYSQVTFKNYLRVITGSSAGPDGTLGNQLNVIGDQGGAETIGFGYEGPEWTISFQHEIPYNDKSGMRFQNFPDGINTFSFSFKDKNKWVSDIVYEFYYTMWQSGPFHDEQHYTPGDNPEYWIGTDNYFNNSEFRSGWTYYNRPIGTPLFFPIGTLDRTWNRYDLLKNGAMRYGWSSYVENNRVIANHFGIGGKLGRKFPYKLMATLSHNFGTYFIPYAGECVFNKPVGSVKEQCLTQFSLGLTGEVPFNTKGLCLTYGLYGDWGQVLENQMGITLGLKYIFLKH